MLISPDRVLITKRCALRHPQLADAPFILDAVTHPLFPKELPFAQINTMDAIEGAMRDRHESWRTGSGLSWCVEERSSGVRIGMVRIGRKVEAPEAQTTDRWTLAFWVHPASWRQGYATEFSGEAVRVAFAELGAVAFLASAPTWNVPSQRVLGSLGFTMVGEEPEGYRINGQPFPAFDYALPVERWRERTSSTR